MLALWGMSMTARLFDRTIYRTAQGNIHNEPIHGVDVSLKVSLNDDHQMLKYQSFDPSML